MIELRLESPDVHGDRGTEIVRAVVSRRGASLRSLSVHGVELIRSTRDQTPPLAAGVVLVPWPNRVAGATWELNGQTQVLEASESGTANAIHGLLANFDYEVVAQTESMVRVEAIIDQAPGYPFHLITTVEYALTAAGVTVTHSLTNRSDTAAPVALGTHPYIRLGDWDVDDLTLTIKADEILPLDDNYFPTLKRVVEGDRETLGTGRLVPQAIDHACLTGLTAQDGKYRHTLTAPDGQTVELWAETDFDYVQIYITDDFPDPDSGQPSATCTAIAIEPMTAPPNALQSGEGLRWLDAEERWQCSWGIELR